MTTPECAGPYIAMGVFHKGHIKSSGSRRYREASKSTVKVDLEAFLF